jgi:hypothetical protein
VIDAAIAAAATEQSKVDENKEVGETEQDEIESPLN